MKKTLFVMLLASLLVFSFVSCSDSPSTEVLTSFPEEAIPAYTNVLAAFDKAIEPINGDFENPIYMTGVEINENTDPSKPSFEQFIFKNVDVYGDGVKLNGEVTNTSTSSKIDLTYGSDSVSFTLNSGDEVFVLTVNGKKYTMKASLMGA